ncbi:SDR family oxidoreductase [Streptomyces sp. CB03238]|uniref:SDR family NAD(P)-dependent oxidoreductase n=1 Tax=Streptomyces sp. CB03238 TaxID=1907777 RepID=UPI0015C45712|nr:SDR family oxidoreductase [Streptomyces sp. CB03238]
MSTTFEGKRIVVTGAARGIGAGIAELLLERGAEVIGTHYGAVGEAEELCARHRRLTLHRVDLTRTEEIEALARDVAAGGAVDGLVNHAATLSPQLWEDFRPETWRRVFAVNVDAPVVLVHALRGALVPGSAVVNVSSTDGLTGSFASIAYSAAKAALINVTKSLGNLMGPTGVRVNAVAPGCVDSDMATTASLAAAEQTPLARNGTPRDVASAVAFLLTPEAAFVNGETLVIDGGYGNVDPIMRSELADFTAAFAAAADDGGADR